jgi:hypothetical protein
VRGNSSDFVGSVSVPPRNPKNKGFCLGQQIFASARASEIRNYFPVTFLAIAAIADTAMPSPLRVRFA